ncbi:MAG: AsmA-like C-terminal region-containing protein [Planctomycetota bacterium]
MTFGRGIVLVILGMAIGTGLFLQSWLSSDTLTAQVARALRDRFAAPFNLHPDQIELDLESGLIIRNLAIPYPDERETNAIVAERIEITVDHEALMGGIVHIRQVDVHGLTLTLRRDPARDGLPGLPGILRPPPPASGEEGPPPPLFRVHPGIGGSWLVLREEKEDAARTGPYPRLLRSDRPLLLNCVRAEVRPTEGGRHITAAFRGDQLTQGTLNLELFPYENRVVLDVEMEQLTLKREDFNELSDELRSILPPIIAEGRTDVEAHAEIQLNPGKIRDLSVTAAVSELNGSFGNMFTGESHDYPFRFADGSATVEVRGSQLRVDDFKAKYLSPAGDVGQFRGKVFLDWELGPAAPLLDVELEARNMRGAEFDLRRMLQRDVVENLVDPFRVAGLFDLDIKVQKIPARLPKMWLDIHYREGTATFAGHLDPETRRRFGFDYPLERGEGYAHYESNLINSHGAYDIFVMEDVRGFRTIQDPAPGGPEEVEVRVDGELIFYGEPIEDPIRHAVVRVRVDDLPIDGKLEESFRKSGLDLPYRGLNLEGWVDQIAIDIVLDGWADDRPYASYAIDLRDCSIAYENFPLEVRNIAGRIRKHDRDPRGRDAEVIEFENLRGDAVGGGTIRAGGRVLMPTLGAEEWKVEVATDDLRLGPALAQALARSTAEGSEILTLWDKLGPHGTVGARVRIGAEETDVDVLLRGDAHLRGYGDTRCPISHLVGSLSIRGNDVEIHQVKGRIGTGALWISGELTENGGIDISSSLHHLTFTPEVLDLIGAFAPTAAPRLRDLKIGPKSSADMALHVVRPSADDPTQLDATLTKLVLAAELGGVPVDVRGGPVRVRDDHFDARDLRVRTLEATVQVREARIPRAVDGHGWVMIDARDLVPEQHLVPILGPGVYGFLGPDIRVDLERFRVEFNRGDETLLFSGAVDLRRIRAPGPQGSKYLAPTGRLGLSPLTVRLPGPDAKRPVRVSGVIEYEDLNLSIPVDIKDMNGELLIAEGTFTDHFACTGAIQHGSAVVFGRTIEEASLNIDFSRELMRFHDLDADFYEGRLRGDVDVHFEDPGGFRIDLRMEKSSLAAFLKDEGMSGDEYSGLVSGALQLESPSSQVRHMRGRAELRITEGQLLKVPGLRNLLGVVGRVVPFGDRPRFKQCDIDLDIRGETFDVQRLHLSTNVNDIYGFGRMTLYGDLELLIFPQVTRAIDLPRLANVPFLSAIGNAWFKNVNEIRVEGTIDSPVLRRRALPAFKKDPKPFTQSPHAIDPQRARPRVLPE